VVLAIAVVLTVVLAIAVVLTVVLAIAVVLTVVLAIAVAVAEARINQQDPVENANIKYVIHNLKKCEDRIRERYVDNGCTSCGCI